MKCPKCGYTSFESYDSCRKCSADLVEFKQSHGLVSMLIPPTMRAEMAAELGIATSSQSTTSDTGTDMFTFDLPTEQQQAAASPAAHASPFSFDDTPAASFDAPSSAPDPFASLMSGASQPTATVLQPPAQGFEINSFSWDDTPSAPGGTDGAKKSDDDDFNSLFGDLGETDKK